MTNKEITSIVRKAQRVKPYAKVHFPYSVEHVERILGTTFNDEDRSDIQKFFDTANFLSKFESIDYRYNPLYPVILSMCDCDDFLSVQEAEVLYNSLIISSRDKDVDFDMHSLAFFSWCEDFTVWTYTPKMKYVFDININLIRREVNLANLLNEPIDYVELEPTYTYEDYGAYMRGRKYINAETLSSRL
jgi:hypothetical protein